MTATDQRPQLNILDGGRVLPVAQMHRILLDAYVTDTRLMGVLAVGSHWSIVSPTADRNDPDSWEELYQFIYIDCEEAGFETYQQVRGDADSDVDDEADRIENAMVCGLGAEKVELDERQLRLLLQNWAQFNREHDLPMPGKAEQYEFLLEPRIEADPAEQAELMQMICPPIESDEQVVNYFLMRCFGRDYDGARYLAGTDDLPLDLYDSYVRATFCRNAMELHRDDEHGARSYACESLVEMDGSYETIVSLVTVRNLKIVGFEHWNRLPVSSAEAALILKKPEFISTYDVLMSEESLEENIDEFTLGFRTTFSKHPNGRLFMKYRPGNDHVDNRLFLLSNDVQGVFFLTSSCAQLLVCAHTRTDLRALQTMISRSVLKPYMMLSGSYHTREPILYEFINSDYPTFQEFIRDTRGM